MLAAIFLPTLAVGMEQALIHDPPALVAALRAFNRWLVEDWGFAYQDRIFAAPIFTLVDPQAAVAELEWALDQDGNVLLLQSRPETVWSAKEAAPVAEASANPLSHVMGIFGGRK